MAYWGRTKPGRTNWIALVCDRFVISYGWIICRKIYVNPPRHKGENTKISYKDIKHIVPILDSMIDACLSKMTFWEEFLFQIIVFSFREFILFGDKSECLWNVLLYYDLNSDARTPQEFCGSQLPHITRSSGNAVMFELHVSGALNWSGFRLDYAAVHNSSESRYPVIGTGKFKKGHACVMYASASKPLQIIPFFLFFNVFLPFYCFLSLIHWQSCWYFKLLFNPYFRNKNHARQN